MIKNSIFKLALLTTALFTLPVAEAAAMTKSEYQANRTNIEVDYESSKAACGSQAGNGKDLCIEESKAKQKIALAELEYVFTGKAADRNKVQVAKAEANYAVARERCDDLAGNVKDVCVKEAKATRTKSLADAKLGKDIGEARKDAASEKIDADYGVAIEKCNALAGDAKANCVASAKMTYGKS